MLYDSYDTGWLLQVGQHILDHGLPSTDIFSWTCPHRVYVVYQWLFAVCAAVAFRLGSLWLVGLCVCITAGLLIFMVLPRMWLSRGIPICVSLAVLALVQTPHWFNARPQLCSFFFILAFVSILERFRTSAEKNTKWLLVLPLLMVLWVNLHPFWFIGLICLATYLICDARRSKRLSLPLSLCTTACAACVLLNPYGFGLVSYLVTFINGSQYGKIWELLPWYTSDQFAWTILYLPLSAVIFWRGRARVPLEGFVLSAAAAVAALSMRRFEPILVLISWTYLALALSGIDWSKISLPVRRGLIPLRLLQPLCAVAIAVVAWFSHFPSILSAAMIYTDNAYPLLMVVQSHLNPQDRIFNDATTGSWLIALGHIPVFIDSRLDMYPKDFAESATACLDAKPGWTESLNDWGITQIVMRDDTVLSQQLLSSPEWTLVLDDGLLNWWMRSSPETEAKLNEWGFANNRISQSKLPPYIIDKTVEIRAVRYLQLARQYMLENQPNKALSEAQKGLYLMPDSAALRKQTELCAAALTGRQPL